MASYDNGPCATAAPARDPDVVYAANALAKAIDSLGAISFQLVDRLAPVMNPGSEVGEDRPKRILGTCPVSERFYSAADGVECIERRLLDAMSRLEI